MAKKYWHATIDDKSYTIEMFHGGVSGKVIVYVNDQRIIENMGMGNDGDMLCFTLEGHQFLIYANLRFVGMNYDLTINNRSIESGEIKDYFKKFQEEREKWSFRRDHGKFGFLFLNGILRQGVYPGILVTIFSTLFRGGLKLDIFLNEDFLFNSLSSMAFFSIFGYFQANSQWKNNEKRYFSETL